MIEYENLNKMTNEELESIEGNIQKIMKSRLIDFSSFTAEEKIKYLNDYLDKIERTFEK